MTRRFIILAAAILFASSLTVLISSCGKDDDPTPDPVMVATSIELVSGGSQTAFTSEALSNAVEVMVKDQEGNAFAGEVVKFAVSEGSVSAAAVTTGADGKASVTWTLGATEGTQTLSITGTSTLIGAPISVTATAEYKPVIGDFKYGGVIFYIDETEKHGLVCAVTDQSSGAEWGCDGTTTGATGTAIGTGAQNTLDILAGCGTDDIAADLCADLTLNSFDDWFLPSKDELNDSGSVFADDIYVSSTEGLSTAVKIQNMETGEQNSGFKDDPFRVRAVREF